MSTAVVPLRGLVDAASLPPGMLYRACDSAQFTFQTTAELDLIEGTIGQARALEAIEMGLSLRRKGYNLFAVGAAGTGKRTILDALTRQRAAREPTWMNWPLLWRLISGRAAMAQ